MGRDEFGDDGVLGAEALKRVGCGTLERLVEPTAEEISRSLTSGRLLLCNAARTTLSPGMSTDCRPEEFFGSRLDFLGGC